jgi:hypothetical protein
VVRGELYRAACCFVEEKKKEFKGLIVLVQGVNNQWGILIPHGYGIPFIRIQLRIQFQLSAVNSQSTCNCRHFTSL